MADELQPDAGEYNFDLWIKLETTIDMYEQDRTEYWDKRLESEEWTPLKQLRQDSDEIAKLIRKRALALQDIGQPTELNAIYQSIEHAKERLVSRLTQGDTAALPEGALNAILQRGLFKFLSSESQHTDDGQGDNISDAPMKLIWERLWIDDAWDVVLGIRQRSFRIWELERLVERLFSALQPPEPCARFLSLISRCYVFGFTPECVAMCRAGMEQAFRDRITEEHCQQAGQSRDTLAGMIETAFHKSLGLIPWDPKLYQAAQAVRDRGKKVLHYDPDATKDALGTIEAALKVIGALSKIDPSST